MVNSCRYLCRSEVQQIRSCGEYLQAELKRGDNQFDHCILKVYCITCQLTDELVNMVLFTLSLTSESMVQFFLFKRHMDRTFAKRMSNFAD